MILGLGDCNLRGADNFKGKTYLDIVGEKLNKDILNCGITMSTTREGVILFNENKHRNPDLVVVAYGLVDSWKTFKYSPYVLYYPNNFFRKIARKIVKKYKKTARKLGLNEILGEKFVVPEKEYKQNISYIIENSSKVSLIQTPPHKIDLERNGNIKLYNGYLEELARKYDNCEIVKIYEEFEKNDNYYLDVKNDGVHISQEGYEFIAEKIMEKL